MGEQLNKGCLYYCMFAQYGDISTKLPETEQH